MITDACGGLRFLEAKEDLIRRISLLKRNTMAAPFEKAIDEHHRLAEASKGFNPENAPTGEGSEVMVIRHREEEAMYIQASHDRVTVIFSTVFREETDRIFGKVFLSVRFGITPPGFIGLAKGIIDANSIFRSLWTLDGELFRMLLRFFTEMIRHWRFVIFRV